MPKDRLTKQSAAASVGRPSAAHRDENVQASVAAALRSHAGAVRGGHGADDGEAEPDASAAASPSIEAPEGLEQRRHHIGGDGRAPVVDPAERPAPPGARFHPAPPPPLALPPP